MRENGFTGFEHALSPTSRLVRSACGLFTADSHPLGPAASFLARMLRDGLSRCRHLKGSTEDVLREITQRRFTSSCLFATFDIQDFYMCGTAQLHKSLAFKHVQSPGLKSALQGALEDLITNQYVSLGPAGPWFQVMVGTGMGQKASGEIADNTFFELAERGWAALCEVQASHSILCYLRYRDDILIIGENAVEMGRFVHEMRERVRGTYQIELSGNSRKEMPFLDVCLKKGEDIRAGHLTWTPFFKPTSQHLLLCQDSGHAPFVHRSWPRAEIARLAGRSTSQTGFEIARARLIEKWSNGPISERIIVESLRESFSSLRCRRSKQTRDQVITFWLVLPFHPAWFRSNIRSTLAELTSKWQADIASVFGCAWSIQVSWQNQARNIIQLVRC